MSFYDKTIYEKIHGYAAVESINGKRNAVKIEAADESIIVDNSTDGRIKLKVHGTSGGSSSNPEATLERTDTGRKMNGKTIWQVLLTGTTTATTIDPDYNAYLSWPFLFLGETDEQIDLVNAYGYVRMGAAKTASVICSGQLNAGTNVNNIATVYVHRLTPNMVRMMVLSDSPRDGSDYSSGYNIVLEFVTN